MLSYAPLNLSLGVKGNARAAEKILYGQVRESTPMDYMIKNMTWLHCFQAELLSTSVRCGPGGL